MVSEMLVPTTLKGGWGQVSSEDALAVSGSVLALLNDAIGSVANLPKSLDLEALAPGAETYPRVVAVPLPDERAWVQVVVHTGFQKPGMDLCSIAYQFAHEWTHVRANSWGRPWAVHSHHWLEEAICGGAALFAVRTWSGGASGLSPTPAWLGDMSTMRDFEGIETPRCGSGKSVASLSDWYSRNRGQIEENSSLTLATGDLAISARDWFIEQPALLEAVPALNLWDVTEGRDLGRHIELWIESCARRGVPDALPRKIGSQMLLQALPGQD